MPPVDIAHETQSASSPLFIASLQLCQASYCAQESIAEIIQGVERPLSADGYWKLLDVVSDDGPNLAFVAAYIGTGGNPLLVVVVFRGTTTEAVTNGDIWDEVLQDLLVINQCPVPWLDQTQAKISRGSYEAYEVVMGFSFNGVDLCTYVRDMYSGFAGDVPPLLIIGHSLGGCLASIFAPRLSVELQELPGKAVWPITFAAPTAGNDEFVTYAQSMCVGSFRFTNTRDIVPHGWNGLRSLKSIYDDCSSVQPINAKFWQDVEALAILTHQNYKQPEKKMALYGVCWLPIIVPPSGIDWFSEALHQHHTTTYMKLMGGKNLPGMAACSVLSIEEIEGTDDYA